MLAAVKRKSDKHIVCAKTVIATPGTEEEVQELCKEILEWSRERMKDRDSGIISFDVSQDSYEPNVFHFWECYESNNQMGKHNTSEEMTEFLEAVSAHSPPHPPALHPLPRPHPLARLRESLQSPTWCILLIPQSPEPHMVHPSGSSVCSWMRRWWV